MLTTIATASSTCADVTVTVAIEATVSATARIATVVISATNRARTVTARIAIVAAVAGITRAFSATTQ